MRAQPVSAASESAAYCLWILAYRQRIDDGVLSHDNLSHDNFSQVNLA